MKRVNSLASGEGWTGRCPEGSLEPTHQLPRANSPEQTIWKVREEGGVLALTMLVASDEALGRKVFEMLRHRASCKRWFVGLLEALTAGDYRFSIATLVDVEQREVAATVLRSGDHKTPNRTN
jgi:hypothetical protein